MKHTISILFLSLFLFNVLGYYGFFLGLKINNTTAVRSKLDREDYAIEQTVTIKVPLSLPYPLLENGYKRVDGEFQHKGEFFRLIKQKFENDTLFIVCFKDNRSKEINRALADYVKSFTDAPVDTQPSNAKTTLSLIKDYFTTNIEITIQHSGWTKTISYPRTETPSTIDYEGSIIHPPERA